MDKYSKLLNFGIFFIIACITSCSHKSLQNQSSNLKAFTIRMLPGQDIKKQLQTYAENLNLNAASIVSVVGSLKEINIRFANNEKPTTLRGFFEVVSLSGTLAKNSMHIHLSVSDKNGKTLGGHLMEGNLVYTTLEVTILEQVDKQFVREQDATTGYKELKIISNTVED